MSGTWSIWNTPADVDPINWAVDLTHQLMEARDLVEAGRLDNVESFPGYCMPVDNLSTAARIIGVLLDAGWTPPERGVTP